MKDKICITLGKNIKKYRKLRGLTQEKMGVFQITPVDSTDVSDMGINDTSTIEKKITAVANVVFQIK